MTTGSSSTSSASTLLPRGSFQEQAVRVLGELRHAFLEIVHAAPQPVRRAVELQRALEVDAPLAWRVFKVATADDGIAAAPYIPTRGQIQTLLEAAERRGLPAAVIARARRAAEAYEELRREHAGDREALDAMIVALRPGGTGEIDERTRRTAFKQNARIWGLQAQTAVRAFILLPGPDASKLNTAAVAGLVGLHAVRPDVPLVVHATALFDSGKGAIGESAEGTYRAEDRTGVMREFCTPGLELRTEVGEDQMLTTRIAAPGIGRRAAVTTFSLTVSEVSTEDLNSVILGHGTSTPVELCHLELLAPAGLTDPATARMAVYGRRTRVDRASERRPADLMPIREPVVHLGELRDVPPLTGVPRWPEVMRHALTQVGAGAVTFDVYRCSVPYPVLHTFMCLLVDARPRGAQE